MKHIMVEREDPEWFAMWATLRELHQIKGYPADSLGGWMYMGPTTAVGMHCFKNRYCVEGENTYEKVPWSAGYFLAREQESVKG